jgi:hypothetical protein
MLAIDFPERNVLIAEHQDEYLTLPALYGPPTDPQRKMLTCWKMTLHERLLVLLTGKVWMITLTFGKKFHPTVMLASKPDLPLTEGDI